MEIGPAVSALSALAHEGRLAVFRLLVRAGDGVAAGEIARQLGVPANSLSANLNLLTNARLVERRRQGRSIVYSAAYQQMAPLIGFLVEDCCQGSPAVCVPLATVVRQADCPPGPKRLA